MIISIRNPYQQHQNGRNQREVSTEILRTRDISIIQFNCGQANHKSSRPIFDALEPEKRLVLAIQEPAFNKFTESTYCPRGFKLIYDAKPTTRVCFLISEELGIDQWRYKVYSPHVIRLEIQVEEGYLSIINVYNPPDNGPRIRMWPQIEKAIKDAVGEVILLGDFNAHHPVWGGGHVQRDPEAIHLLQET